MSDVQIPQTPVAGDPAAVAPSSSDASGTAPVTAPAPAAAPITPAGPVNAPGAPAAPAPSAEVTIDTSQFVTKDDLAGFLTELKAAVVAAQPAAAVAAVTPPDFHLTLDEAPKEGTIVDYLGRPAQVLEVLETPRKDSAGNEWTQVVLHIGVFTQEHTVDAEQVTRELMAAGARTYSAEELYDAPFTDHERAAAGLPPIEARDPARFAPTHGAYKRELRRQDLEQRRANDPHAGETEGSDEGHQARPRGQGARGFGRIAPAAGRAVSGKVGGGIASAVLGLAAYAIGANYLTGGWPQVKGWFGAKFENRPYQGAANPIPAATSAAPAPVQSAVVAPLVTV